MNSTTTGQVIDTFTSTITSYFTDNIGIIISFVVGFMVLSLLWRMAKSNFIGNMISDYKYNRGDYDEPEDRY